MGQYDKIMHAQKILQNEMKASKSQLSEQRFSDSIEKNNIIVKMTLNGHFELLDCDITPQSTPFEHAKPLLIELHQLVVDAINLQMQRDIHRISNQLAQLSEEENHGTESH